MDDDKIILLFKERDERAIEECRTKYGAVLKRVAVNILGSPEDADECINDVWLRAWNSIPAHSPVRLSAYLVKTTRNLAIDRLRSSNADMRGAGMTQKCYEEIGECAGGADVADEAVLKTMMEEFLRKLDEKSRSIFLYRYFYFYSEQEICELTGMRVGAVKMRLVRARKALKEYLEEGLE